MIERILGNHRNRQDGSGQAAQIFNEIASAQHSSMQNSKQEEESKTEDFNAVIEEEEEMNLDQMM